MHQQLQAELIQMCSHIRNKVITILDLGKEILRSWAEILNY